MVKSRYIDYKISLNVCIEQSIIQNNKIIVQFEIEDCFVTLNFLEKSRIVLIRFAIIEFIIFKFKVTQIDSESSKFISENSTIILLIENINTDFDSIEILRIVII